MLGCNPIPIRGRKIFTPRFREVDHQDGAFDCWHRAHDPYDWQFRRVSDFGFKCPQLDRMKREFPDAPLRDLNRCLVADAIIPDYLGALELRRPTIDMVKLIGIRIGYERLILPQKGQVKPG